MTVPVCLAVAIALFVAWLARKGRRLRAQARKREGYASAPRAAESHQREKEAR